MAGRNAYWEFNFSPAGDWASYHFTGYRAGRVPEEKISNAGCRPLESTFSFKTWEIVVDVANLSEFAKNPELFLGLAAVIETKTGQKTYWALLHCDDKPDFHRRESFIYKSF